MEGSIHPTTWKMALGGLVFTALSNVATSHIHNRSALRLEQQKFEDSLVQRAFDVEDDADRLKYLEFVRASGLAPTIDHALAELVDELHRTAGVASAPEAAVND